MPEYVWVPCMTTAVIVWLCVSLLLRPFWCVRWCCVAHLPSCLSHVTCCGIAFPFPQVLACAFAWKELACSTVLSDTTYKLPLPRRQCVSNATTCTNTLPQATTRQGVWNKEICRCMRAHSQALSFSVFRTSAREGLTSETPSPPRAATRVGGQHSLASGRLHEGSSAGDGAHSKC